MARVFDAHPELIEQYLAFYHPWHSNSNGCLTCQSARLAPESVPEEQATGVWKDDFAERMAIDHHGIGDADIEALHEHFDDAEILELMMMAGQSIGFGRTLAILQLETVACPIPSR